MTVMNRRTVVAAAGAGLVLPGLARARAVDPRDAMLDAAATRTGAPPAMAAAVVTRDGVEWSGVRGVRKSDGTDPAGPHDRWHLGSNTKAMTAAIWARLIEQGRARWDMPLAEAFPDVKVDAAYDGLTVETLLRHKAGLLDKDNMPSPMVARADPRPVGEQRAALAVALTRAPTGSVGQFVYGNLNYMLVGAAIELITGQSWEDVTQAELFRPLGLTSAGFGAPTTNDDGGANAWGHQVQGETRTPVDPAEPWSDNPPVLGPAGRVHMTMADYGRFLQAMMGAGPDGWLSADSLARLTTPAPGDGYALGWIVMPGGMIGHEGSNTLWHVIGVAKPAEGRAVIVASNGGMAGRTATAPLARRLIEGV